MSGHENPRCYAGELGNCSAQISREHYFSRALLEAAGGRPEAAGFPFQEPGVIQGFGLEALTAKILCEAHNSELSSLDAEVTQFFRALRESDRDLRDGGSPTESELEVDGSLLERWMLKMMAGLVAAKLVSSTSLRPDAPWLAILFGREDWPEGWGLYMRTDGEPLHAFDGLEVMTLTVGDEIWCARVGIAGFMFQLCLGTPEGDAALVPRPAGLVMGRSDSEVRKRIRFKWPGGARGEEVSAIRVGQYDGPRPQDRQLRRN